MSNPGIARGGKALYGAAVGILMLEARFPRIPGDVGNAHSFPFPVLYRVVRGASPDRVVRHEAEGLLGAFLEAAGDLVRDGADGLVTNCGFLSLLQAELAARAGVPVATSSLIQAPLIERLLPPGRRVGVLTISRADLSDRHLDAAGVARDTPVEGTDSGREFSRVILNDEVALDTAAAAADILDAGRRLVERHPEVGAILLECTNMCPYAKALQNEIGLPVFDMVNFITWFQGGLRPQPFPPA
jgi:Asp/Glu/hydantoin racemase